MGERSLAHPLGVPAGGSEEADIIHLIGSYRGIFSLSLSLTGPKVASGCSTSTLLLSKQSLEHRCAPLPLCISTVLTFSFLTFTSSGLQLN